MTMAIVAVVFGLVLLLWSAERFLEGAASIARHFGMPPLLIGMVVVGFGTSAPEMVVSALSAAQGNPGIALGNAFGSNITNIALVLGLSALISPIVVQSQVLRSELPILTGVTGLAALLLMDGALTRPDSVVMLLVFAGLMAWTIRQGLKKRHDSLGTDVEHEIEVRKMTIGRAVTWLIIGLCFLIASSRLLVWGAVKIAQDLGVSDMIIGLTIVALGTSLPELASSVIAARKGEDELALGNILGSNLFNTLAVVGIAGTIYPTGIGPDVFGRDIMVMSVLTLSLFVFGYGFRGNGSIGRLKGLLLLASYAGYTGYLITQIVGR